MSTVRLVRNVALLPDEPETFDDLVSMSRNAVNAGRVERNGGIPLGPEGDPFMIWPLFTSAGGGMFRRTPAGDAWDPTKVCFDSPESIEALRKISQFSDENVGVLDKRRGQAELRADFFAGRIPFMLDVPDMTIIAGSDVEAEVSAVPPWKDGTQCTPFGVAFTFVVAPDAAGDALAEDILLDYLGRPDVRRRLASKLSMWDGLAESADAYLDGGSGSVAMPAFPNMSEIWKATGRAIVAVVDGSDAQAAAVSAATAMRQSLQ